MPDDFTHLPGELSEQHAMNLLAETRAEITERAGAVLGALARLEREVLLFASTEAKLNLAEHCAQGKASYSLPAGPLMAGAVVARLRGLLAPHLGLSANVVAIAEARELELRAVAEGKA